MAGGGYVPPTPTMSGNPQRNGNAQMPMMQSLVSAPTPLSAYPYPSAPTVQNGRNRIILLEDGWNHVYTRGIAKLQSMLSRGFNDSNSFTNAEYADLYTTIYNMCIQKDAHCYQKQLYERYGQSISQYLESIVVPALASKQGEYLLRELVRRWDDHLIMKKWLFDFFKYLDRFYVKRFSQKPLQDIAIGHFRTIVFDPLATKVTAALLANVQKEREGEQIDTSLMRSTIQIYIDIGLGQTRAYSTYFEETFLKASTDYYIRIANAWASSDSCSEYLNKAEIRVEAEKTRVALYLHPSTERRLMDVIYRALLINHQSTLLEKDNTGMKAMLETNATTDLKRLFSLFSAVPSSLPEIANIFQKHIRAVGLALGDKTSVEEDASSYIEQLMSLHDTYLELVRSCFGGHSIFHRALKDAFEHIVNREVMETSTAELLANYSDNVLKKGGVRLNEKQLQQTIDNIVRLFSYLMEKDLFNEFYRKQLATRLLMQRSASSDAEKSIIGKLKLSCGAQFTSKLEGMINDMRNASESASEFQSFLKLRHIDTHNVEFSAHILTTGFWPSYPMDEINLPPILQNCLDAFRIYYDSKTNNRRVRWIHDLGVVTLAANLPRKKVDLLLSTVQACILLLFNTAEQLTIDQMISMTGLTSEVMKQQLKSLVSGKFRLLVKQPADGYSTSHTIRVNMTFAQAMRVLRIPNAIRKTTNKDRANATKNVSEDRKHAIEANIVRVMKTRKVMTHQQLMAEVSAQLMQFFHPDPRFIKQRIEDLIQREYLERDADNRNVYHYLA